jgi:TolB-like protein/DNA-binding winged helix-turn-helix (wHTH) protein/cytochrome c-type biogenesis protein CcmH/NrfG
MAVHDSSSPTQTGPRRFQVDRYVLDLDRGCVLLDGVEVPLRPKTLGVLQYLVENCGRLVSKDALFAAVWPGLAVTDDVLVQSIGELRRALGDDGQRLIKTVPRRGYRLESDAVAVAPAPLGDASEPSDPATHADVLRESVAPASSRRARVGPALGGALAVAVLVAAGLWWSGALIDRDLLKTAGPREASAPRTIDAKPAIAILPLSNQSDDSAREYFADGLTQDIISALGRFPELTVMSWNAVQPFKGKSASPAEITRSLAVRYQVEGTVRQTGDRVRVNAQLVDASGKVLWSGSFDDAFANLFALQDRITTQIAGALAIRVAEIEQRRVFAKAARDLAAYDYVLRARPALQRPDRANNVEARTLLRRALDLDPNYAAAYAGLAETYQIAVAMGWAEQPAEYMNRAEELADRALGLNDNDVRARVVLGRVHIFHHRYEPARAELERAIAINPNDAGALAGRGNILMWLGQADAAIEALELAQRIDPELNAMDRFALSLAYYLKQRYDLAGEQAEFNLRRTSGANFSRVMLAAAYAQQNRMDDVARVVATIHRLDPTFDPQEFGSKFLNAVDLERLREGLRKAGLLTQEAGAQN